MTLVSPAETALSVGAGEQTPNDCRSLLNLGVRRTDVGLSRVTTESKESTLAASCSAALEHGDLVAARTLAERGLKLAESRGDREWLRRFEHLLRVATGTPIEPPDNPPSRCSFCLRTGAVSLTAGKLALICDDCVEACVSGRWNGAVIDGGIAGDVVCAFCGLTRLAVTNFGAGGFFICRDCATWYWEEAIAPEWRP
jgi:hypothetical protein